jgi:hypothetical protein
MKEQFLDLKFRQASIQLLAVINAVIAEYAADGYSLTLRQLYYQCIARDLFPDSWIDEAYNRKMGLAPNTKNTVKSYKKLIELMSHARLAGLVDWLSIEDRTRNLMGFSHWENPKSIIENVVGQYQIDKWSKAHGQRRRVEVWIEKDALTGVCERICGELDISYTACRGFTSQSELYQAGKRFLEFERQGSKPLVLYIGDHDPSGLEMSRDIEDRLEMFCGHPVEVNRIALNWSQVSELGLPPNPAKNTDSRYVEYRKRFGDDCYEVDALSPRVISDLIRAAVVAVRVDRKWKKAVELEEAQRHTLREIARRFTEVEALVTK